MYTILRALIGEMNLWKAVAIFAVIVGLAGWGIWSKHQPETVDSGSWTIDPGGFEGTGVSLNRDGKLLAQFEQSDIGKRAYVAVIVSMAEMLSVPTTPAKDIQGYARAEGSGTLKLGPVELERGSYSVVVMNPSDKPVTLKYRIQALR